MRTFPASLLQPTTMAEVQEAVLYAAPGVGDTTRVRPVAGRSKPALHHAGDGVVPRSRLGEALVGIEAIGKRHGIRVANVFHAGDGNLHPLILFDGRVAGAHDRAEACAAEILRLCIALGGSITGEHGVGLEKRDFLAEQYGEVDIACMKQLQRMMDPADIANPGKVFAPITTEAAAKHFAATAAATERVPS